MKDLKLREWYGNHSELEKALIDKDFVGSLLKKIPNDLIELL
jgi:hypothetical protein